MCGIAGLMTFGNREVPSDLLEAMVCRITHRGPDDSGFYVSPGRRAGLGSSRLSIQDLSPAGHMPMPNEERRIWLTFNGEIYNFRALRPELLRRGHRFSSETDTEVIVHLYEERGIDFLEELEGMFAIALWDEDRQTLLLARDRLGEKPLYYTEHNGIFRFASEIKALHSDPTIPRLPNLEALNQYLTFGFVQAPRTMFEGIHKLAPGERLLVTRDGRRQLSRYWEPLENAEAVRNIRAQTMEQHVYEVRSRLERSVESCLVADVPVGAFLSGGVDSSAVVSLMSRKLGRKVESVTVSYPTQPDRDELAFARMIASHTGANLHPVVVRSEDAQEVFADCVYHQDEPVADPACINTYIASKHLRSMGVPVGLVGEGADELFLGYPSYLAFQKLWPFWRAGRMIPLAARKWLIRAATPLVGSSGNAARRDLLRRASDGEGIFVSTDGSIPDIEKVSMSGGRLKQLAMTRPSAEFTNQMGKDPHGLIPPGDLLSMISLAETRMRMAEQLLMRVDKQSMAHSVELRAPFLNWRMADYVLALPGNVRASRGQPKALLKAAVADLIPEQTLNRPKMGFGTAVIEWCKTWAGDLLETRLTSCDLFRSGLLSAPRIATLLEEHRRGYREHHTQIWNILCLTEWWEQYGISAPADGVEEVALASKQ